MAVRGRDRPRGCPYSLGASALRILGQGRRTASGGRPTPDERAGQPGDARRAAPRSSRSPTTSRCCTRRTSTLTAGEARAGARAIADALRAAGVAPGQAVAVQLPNGPDAITAMFGVWLAGAVFVPVNPRSPEPRAAQRARGDRARPRCSPAGRPRAARRRPTTYDARCRVRHVDVGHDRRAQAGPAHPRRTTSSCSTGCSRRCAATRRPTAGDAARRPTPNLVPVSLALNAGIYNVLFGLRAGAEVVVMDGFDPRAFAELVRRFAIRSTVLPPAAMAMLSDDADGRRSRAVALRAQHHRAAVAAAGASLRRQVRRRRAERLRPGRDRRGHRLDGGRRARASREARRGRPSASRRRDQDRARPRRRRPASTPGPIGRLLVRPPTTAVGIAADAGRRRRLRRHRRPRAHRRRRLRVDRGPGRRRHQPGRQQGVPRARRGGAAARSRRGRGRGRRRRRRPARRGAGRVRRDDAPTCPTTTSSPRAARTSRRTRSRSRSGASTRCRAARSARCCAASSRRRVEPRLATVRRRESAGGQIARRLRGRVAHLRRRRARRGRAPTRGCRRRPASPLPSRS